MQGHGVPCLIVATVNEVIFTQTWHATSLHASGNAAVFSRDMACHV
ncbi:MAG: hypothetical protein HDS16_06010 [Bacteroides sp.]|nr:hypothetical protein [Bacteroides sp.]